MWQLRQMAIRRIIAPRRSVSGRVVQSYHAADKNATRAKIDGLEGKIRERGER